ncbi:hypothetical protein TI04_01355 [Achromatium sp. WMS2]|nr:hypothetical protein TI04_01355 [Achromatium sp. WMS2]
MIYRTGLIIGTVDNLALITTATPNGCERCTDGNSGCSMHKLLIANDGETKLNLPNTIGAKIGDRVNIGINEKRLLQIIVLCYGLPVLGIICGIAAGQWLGNHASLDMELTSGLGGLLGIILSFSWIRYKSHSMFQGQLVLHQSLEQNTANGSSFSAKWQPPV